MTHDDITTRLRDPRHAIAIDRTTTMLDAADRLDRYRVTLEKCLSCLGEAFEDERHMIAEIRGALK